MKQSDNPELFFDKYGFRQTSERPHPIYKDMMHFEGLEAEYVSRLESEIEYYKKAFVDVMQNNERLLSREHWRLRDEIKKLEAKEK